MIWIIKKSNSIENMSYLKIPSVPWGFYQLLDHRGHRRTKGAGFASYLGKNSKSSFVLQQWVRYIFN